MAKAKVAELKNNLSRYLAYVREGGEVLVLDRETPVARLVPIGHRREARGRTAGSAQEDQERLADMERQGIVKRGDSTAVRRWLETTRPIRLPSGAGSVVGELLEMRDEDTR